MWMGRAQLGLVVLLAAALPAAGRACRGADCNENGVDDSQELGPPFPLHFGLARLAALAGTSAIQAGDFDGDGDLDLLGSRITGQGRREVVVLANAGDGSLAAAGTPVDGYGLSPLRAGDLNGDSRLDLAGGTFDPVHGKPGPIVVFLGRDGLVFDPPYQAHSGPVPGTDRVLYLPDLDGDRAADLLTQDTQDEVTTLLGLGDGSFGSPRTVRLDGAFLLAGIADLDGDRDLDLLLASDAPVWTSLHALRNDGKGNLGGLALAGAGTWPERRVLADLSGDGAADLATGEALYWNRGDGTFPTAGEPSRRIAGEPAGDFDGDGAIDLLEGGASPRFTLRLNGGGGAFELGAVFRTGSGEAAGFIPADWDGDGHQDVLVIASTGELILLPAVADAVPSHDTNQDGRLDSCGDVTCRPGDVDGNGAVDLTDPIALLGYLFQGSASPTCLDAGDVQKDGRIDLADAVGILLYLFQGGPAPR
jgi:hypothetical protein